LAIDTQTAYALTLYFSLADPSQEGHVISDLIKRLGKDKDHLKTGFVGTPFICQALSEHGAHDLAVKLFLNEDYPSWLYAVKHGATTVWDLRVSYQIETDDQHTIKILLAIPFRQQVHVTLQAASQHPVMVNGQEKGASFTLISGTYEISYQPDHDFIGHYRTDSPINEIMADGELVERLSQVTDTINFFRDPGNSSILARCPWPRSTPSYHSSTFPLKKWPRLTRF
jgi:hypothetical protein